MVDPGEASGVQAALVADGLKLTTILLTHRHADHIDGVATLRAQYPDATVYAPAGCNVSGAITCTDGQTLSLLNGELSLQVFATPGHTLEHIIFYGNGIVFSGDTLFIGGCGRVVEGSMQQMHDSLAQFTHFADDTLVYCGHEYTRNNLRFAAAVEPQNNAIRAQQTQAEQAERDNIPTVPATLGGERQTNPFLRLQVPAVIAAASQYSGQALSNSVDVFTALRRWKDNF